MTIFYSYVGSLEATTPPKKKLSNYCPSNRVGRFGLTSHTSIVPQNQGILMALVGFRHQGIQNFNEL